MTGEMMENGHPVDVCDGEADLSLPTNILSLSLSEQLLLPYGTRRQLCAPNSGSE